MPVSARNIVCGLVLAASTASAADVDFNRDVRPILAENCFLCHGPDDGTRKAKLRVDVRDAALKGGKSGTAAIVPGKPTEGALVARITSSDPEQRMPPADSKKSLTPQQVETLRQWVESGANYSGHWAFQPPV